MKELANSLTHATVRLECTTYDGQISVGTSFLFLFNVENGNTRIPVLVTNKHVVKNANMGKFLFTNSDELGNPIYGDFIPFCIEENFQDSWIEHPDQNVDLCMMPIGPILNHFTNELGKVPSIKGFSENDLINQGEMNNLSSFEELFMIGYPNALWDEINNQPIVRKGITATDPKLDYNGRKEFLIDVACFPGSSGSPIFQYTKGATSGSHGITFYPGGYLKLLGVLYAGPMFEVNGNIEIREIPTSTIPIAHSRIPMNLGCVIKIEKLLEMKDILMKEIIRPMTNNYHEKD